VFPLSQICLGFNCSCAQGQPRKVSSSHAVTHQCGYEASRYARHKRHKTQAHTITTHTTRSLILSVDRRIVCPSSRSLAVGLGLTFSVSVYLYLCLPSPVSRLPSSLYSPLCDSGKYGPTDLIVEKLSERDLRAALTLEEAPVVWPSSRKKKENKRKRRDK
jgi:hypothetical protein